MQTEGYIHSIETFGTLDGPGVRYVIFMQGCALRCAFCHNPDTWRIGTGRRITVDELVEDIQSYRPYFQSSGGGVTVSGGEPLLQTDFLTLLFQRLEGLGMHKVLDSGGFADLERIKDLINITDLFMLSIKHGDLSRYPEICGSSSERPMALARYLTRMEKPVWIRYVIIPGVTGQKKDLEQLADRIRRMPNVEKVELLPYNTMGVYKWEYLGLHYSLKDIAAPDEQQMAEVRTYLQGLLPSLAIY
ncbi:MAG TPA: pyruvate formate lyase-activating protein [Syntrophomonadaceae bacterium]|nr:pyruvate formate lyase-activating protein [Syntrophomonadaceae bacterium]